MAYICKKPNGSCPTCDHFRLDTERNSKVCFAGMDEKKKRIENLESNKEKYVIAYDEEGIYFTGLYEEFVKIPIVDLGIKEAIFDSKIAMIMALKYNEPFKNL